MDGFLMVLDDFPQHEDDISVDEVMEASFEHAQDEWMEGQSDE